MSYLGRKFHVLMWKNFIVRKRSWFLTLFEIVIPILLFFMIAYVRHKNILGDKGIDVPAYISPVFTEKQIFDYSYVHHDKVNFAFAPNTPFSEQIIKEFNKTLIPVMINGSKLESFKVFDSEVKLETYFYQEFENKSTFTNVVGFGIVLEHTGNDIPKDFKYKIRSTIPMWNNEMTFPQFMPAGPTSEGDIYTEKGFIAIQLAMDNAYIRVAQGESTKVPYNRSIQRFPFPEYQVNTFNDIFKLMMPMITMLSFITISISVLKKVVEEKVSGVTELMKMMGLQTWMVWTGWVLNGLMVYVITCGIITFVLCYSFDPAISAVISHINCTIIFTLYLLFCMASIFFCFAISAFFMRPTIAMSAGMVLWMMSHTMLQSYIGQAGIPIVLFLLMSLTPIFNICSAYIVIAAFESREVDVSWMNLFASSDGTSTSSLGFVMVMFLLQMVVYYVITWYVTSIHPGPYGRAEPWYFIFQLFKRTKKRSILEHFDDDDDYERYEAPSKDLKVGLKIQDLRKLFNGNFVAVDKVNLDIYENQITALLGHNGAGKTTTMSILTGMYSPTAGAVYAKDYNIFENMDRFRSSLGLCPQHDLLFPYLTALEHLMFFGMLKGMPKRSAHREGLELLKMLKISEKKDVLADKLSGGMKRKVSLGIALIGTPQVLVLDEPTSGMDPESRRELWDLLVKLRNEKRTIIITTHFMEEADVLGDRIAIMDHGRVKCYGTSLFLKRAYGTGYQLTLSKNAESPLDPITKVIKSCVPEAELKTSHPTQITYKVPQNEKLNLSSMFKTIESKKSELGISGVGISCTTMEEVFLKVGQLCKEEKEEFDKKSSHSTKDQSTMARSTSIEALTYKKQTGLFLMIQQFKSLLRKRSLFSIRRPVASIIFFALPLLLMLVTIRNGTVDSTKGLLDPPLNLQLSQYGSTEAYVSGPAADQAVYEELITKQGSSVTPVDIDMVNYLMKVGEENIARYKARVIVAADFNTTSQSVKALYNGLAYHSLPISINIISNALLRSNEKTKQNTISTINAPLDLVNMVGSCTQLNEINQIVTAFMWLVLVPIGIKGFLMDLITFPHVERTSNAKQLQLMTGVAPHTYWLACFTWDYFLYFISVLATLAIVTLFDTGRLFSEFVDYGVFFLILVLFGVSAIFNTYIFSFLGKSSTMAGSLFTLITLITGTIAPMVMYFVLKLKDNNIMTSGLIKPIHYLLCFLEPQYVLGSTIINFSYLLSERSACKQCTSEEMKQICKVVDEQSYLSFTSKTNPNGILQFLLFLAFDWILYFAVILLIEYGYMGKVCHWLKVKWVGKDFDKLQMEDEDVRSERDRVDAARGERDDAIVLTVDGLAKKFSRSFAAVQGVSFHVSAGECFGLLGVNGAGKTTTFRMLTGDESPTTGSASILKYNLVKDRSKYLSQIGYCPQFDGINEFLTGEEVLRLFANLRGIPPNSMQFQIDEWISVLGLEEYRHRRCGKYSGGNKRKLSTAMALIGDPPVVFLDEPTTGVDPVARRNLWDVLGRCQKSGQAIVLTSHSMEECEALCTRLTIMVRGRMKCIGSNQYLKNRYGQGYTIMVKLDPKYTKNTSLDLLKQDIQRKFTSSCNLKDEHQSLLHYHLEDTSIKLSQLFKNLEDLQKTHKIIEDFIVSDTTLEQVFIAFARQHEYEH